jgi:hypothetical protein
LYCFRRENHEKDCQIVVDACCFFGLFGRLHRNQDFGRFDCRFDTCIGQCRSVSCCFAFGFGVCFGSASTSTSVADETPEIDDSMFTDIGGKNITLTTDLTYGCPEMGSAMPYHMVTEFADGLFVDTGTWDYYDESFKEYKGDHQYRYFRDDKGKLAYTNPANKNNVIIQGEETDNGETLDFDDTIFQNLLGSLISADFEYSYTTASKEQIFTMTDTAKAGTHATYDNIFNAIGCVNAFSTAGAWGGPVALTDAYVRVDPEDRSHYRLWRHL